VAARSSSARTHSKDVMTNAEADVLIATLPKPGSLRLFREGDAIVMAGGRYGSNTITTGASNAERLLVHWQGYVENNGQTLGPGYTASLTAAKPDTAKPRSKKSRKIKRGFTRIGVVGIYSDPPDGYIIIKPNSTAQATDKVYATETQAIKAARALDEPLGRSKHSLAAVQWKRRGGRAARR
jgi:hypothetical protein